MEAIEAEPVEQPVDQMGKYAVIGAALRWVELCLQAKRQLHVTVLLRLADLGQWGYVLHLTARSSLACYATYSTGP